MNKKFNSIAVIGASPNEDRYSNKLIKKLLNEEVTIYPVAFRYDSIEGIKSFKKIEDINATIDQITMYVSPKISMGMEEAIINSGVRRVIFNPGTENPELMQKLKGRGVIVLEACSLILHSAGKLLTEL